MVALPLCFHGCKSKLPVLTRTRLTTEQALQMRCQAGALCGSEIEGKVLISLSILSLIYYFAQGYGLPEGVRLSPLLDSTSQHSSDADSGLRLDDPCCNKPLIVRHCHSFEDWNSKLDSAYCLLSPCSILTKASQAHTESTTLCFSEG